MDTQVVIKKFPEWLPIIRSARSVIPSTTWPYWHKYSDENSTKYATKDPSRLSESCKLLLQLICLNVAAPDESFPDFDLHGAGLHWIPEGGHLSHHRDGEIHPLTGWNRKASSILFLSDCLGGDLVVDGYEPIRPEPGKLVTFESNLGHKVNQVIRGDRYTLSLFWWSLNGDGVTEKATFTQEIDDGSCAH